MRAWLLDRMPGLPGALQALSQRLARWLSGEPSTAPLSGFHRPYYGREARGLRLLMDATNKCNLRCVMCHFALDEVHAATAIQWPEERVAKLRHEVLPHVVTAYLSAGTEPLMWKGFPGLLGAMRAAGVPDFTMFTNGTLLTEELAQQIVAARMTRLCLSLEGATEDTYESVRVGSRFKQLVEALERLNAAKSRAGSEFPRLQLAFTLMTRNVHELPELLQLAKRHGVRYVSLAHMVVIAGLGVERESLIHHKARANRALEGARALAAELGIELVNPPDNFADEVDVPPPPEPAARRTVSEPARAESAPHARDVTHEPAHEPAHEPGAARPGTPPYALSAGSAARGRDYPRLGRLPAKPLCDAPWKQFGVRPDGGVTPCCFWYTHEPLGDFGTQSFEEIWQGEGYRRLRWEILSGNLGPNCARCPVNGIGALDDEQSFQALNTRDQV